MSKSKANSFPHLVELLRWRASEIGERRAVTFLVDGEDKEEFLTYRDLDARARALGGWLQEHGAQGRRVLLLHPPGLAYVTALWGCLYAGAVAVPALPPRRRERSGRLEAIVNDSQAEFLLTCQGTTDGAEESLDGLLGPTGRMQVVDSELIPMEFASSWRMPSIGSNDLAFLQYTSGSTAKPKGVMVSHGNLMANEKAMQVGFELTDHTVISWLPVYHDMGLIGNILNPTYMGGHCVLMSPTAFVQRPVRWLRAVTRFKGMTTGGPSFGYDLCIEKISAEERQTLDLTSWELAYCGAEPIRASTLRRFAARFAECGFSPRAYFPCYGLAEATLFVSGGPRATELRSLRLDARALERHEVVPASTEAKGEVRELVSNGPVWDQTVKIVDPDAAVEVAPSRIGEVWISGPNVAKGYWGDAEATEAAFQARIVDGSPGPFLRTGDLGFMQNDELFITGRIKDMLIIRGRNLYPQDIESSVETSHRALRRSCCAAFSVDVEGEEQLVVVQELERGARSEFDPDEVFAAIRSAVTREHLVLPHAIVLIDTLTLLKTSSGKVRRRANRTVFLEGKLKALAAWTAPLGAGDPLPDDVPAVPPPATTRSRIGADGTAPLANAEAVKAPSKGIGGFDNPLYPAETRLPTADLLTWLRDYANTRLNSRLIDERRTIPPYVVLDFGNRGLLGMQIPRAYGGPALKCVDLLQVLRQLGAIDQSLATFVGINNTLGVHPILHHASAEVRERMLPLLASGRELAGFAITEPGAGSNPGAMRSLGIPGAAGQIRLQGEKSWIGLGSWAGAINVFVREQRHDGSALGVSGFVVRQGTPGLRQGPEALTMGMRGMVQNTVYLDDVAVSEVHRLGTPGAGMNVAQETMMYMRLGIGAGCVGTMQRAAQLMLRYASRRQVATGPLLDNPVTRTKLSHLIAATDAVDALVMRLGAALDSETAVPVDLFAACKIAAPELAWSAVDDLAQLLGGRGYIESNLVPQMIRDTRVARVFEGPTETLRMFLGARVLNQPEDMVRFLSEHLGAAAVAARLVEAAAQVKEQVGATQLFGDDGLRRQWAYNLCGELATWAALVAAADSAHAQTGQPRHLRARRWAELRFEGALAAVRGRVHEEILLGAGEIEQMVAGFEPSIGDVEQSLPGEQQGMDALLRRDGREGSGAFAPAAAVPPAPSTPLDAARPVEPARSALQAAPADAELAGERVTTSTPSDRVRRWMIDWMARAMRLPRSRIDVNMPFADYGLDSIKAIEFAQDLEAWLGGQIEIEESASWKYPTIAALAEHVCARLSALGINQPGEKTAPGPRPR